MYPSTKIGRVCVGTFDAETIERVETSDAAMLVAYLLSELKTGRMQSIAERVLIHGYGQLTGTGISRPAVYVELLSDGNGTVTAVHSTKPVSNKRRRIDIALLRELVDHKFLQFRHVSTEKMVADALTKAMACGSLKALANENVFDMP